MNPEFLLQSFVFLVAAMVVIVRMVMIVVMRMGMRVRLTAESVIVSHAFP